MVDANLYPMILDGVDFTTSFKYNGQSEARRKVHGPNAGRLTLDGTEWTDLIAVKYDLTATIMPMKSAELAALEAVLKKAYVTQRYFSGLRNQLVTREVTIPDSAVILAMIKHSGTVPVYANMSIVFRER